MSVLYHVKLDQREWETIKEKRNKEETRKSDKVDAARGFSCRRKKQDEDRGEGWTNSRRGF
jgi:hypothetical protein